MPCICHGSVSDDDMINNFLISDKGKEVMKYLTYVAGLLKSHPIDLECDMNEIDFRNKFIKAFTDLLLGCDEEYDPRPKR